MLKEPVLKIIITVLTSFALGLLLGKIVIPMLRKLHAEQSIREEGPKWHNSKAGTPTMGGLIFIGCTFLCLLFGIRNMAAGDFSALYVLALSLCFGAIGFLDDFFKVKLKRNLGLTAIQKSLLQMAVAAIYLYVLYRSGLMSCDLYIPFVGATLHIHPLVYILFAMFVVVGCVNAVNLTDGLDGLAGSVTLAVAVFFVVLAKWWEFGAIGIFAGALAGGLLGFLLYNFYPAKVFMGDTGSLFLGGAVCAMAFALDVPLVLVFVGVIYIAETMSDIIQIGYFKLTHGKRIFRMAPLHHHLELGGWNEVRIVLTFTGITVAFCLLAFVGVMYRYAI